MAFQYGIEALLENQKLLASLKGRKVGLVAHPASVTQDLHHSLDALLAKRISIAAAFGPQHGLRGEKQDNMIESDDYVDPIHNIPVWSLYGSVRRPTAEMLAPLDVILFDLQDVGCRIYTFLTTLIYLLQDLAQFPNKELWILDRPNPVGRPVEGNLLDMDFATFVGAAPVPMRHGLTLGEMALLLVKDFALPTQVKVIPMIGYVPEEGPNFGWPTGVSWVNPSPNMPRLSCARLYAGTVLIEGTSLSEGRGTTIP